MLTNSSQKVALLPLHGMGPVNSRYADKLKKAIQRRLGKNWDKVIFRPVHYQKVLQDNQDRVWESMKRRNLDWTRLRRFVLFGFSDAAGIERNAHRKGSPYTRVQQIIRAELQAIYDETEDPNLPVVVIAQSLGGHVISNYIWDAQSAYRRDAVRCTRGVWAGDGSTSEVDGRADGATAESADANPVDAFLRLRKLRYLYTTGCNIPIFVASFPEPKIVPVATDQYGYDFRWKNFFDDDDVLGWPLKPLSNAYDNAVCFDKRVNAGGLVTNWNPFSHGRYWTDDELLSELVADIESLLGESGNGSDDPPSVD